MSDHPTIIRTRKNRDNPYTMIARQPLNDARLSWEARGVLAYLLDKPDDWEVRFQDLVQKGPGAADRMRRILKELETAGYVRRQRSNDPRGRLRWATFVYETPALAADDAQAEAALPPPTRSPSRQNRHMVSASPSAGLPYMAEPSMVLPSMENRHIYKDGPEPNTNLPNTEGERAAPPLPEYKSLTIDGALMSWWRGHCMGAGINPNAVDVPGETEKWRDEISRGAREVPANAVADWRQWMRRALSWAKAHPEAPYGSTPRTDQRHLEPDLAEREARAAQQLIAALSDPLPEPRPAPG